MPLSNNAPQPSLPVPQNPRTLLRPHPEVPETLELPISLYSMQIVSGTEYSSAAGRPLRALPANFASRAAAAPLRVCSNGRIYIESVTQLHRG
jgi:hypothetical protein